jgi:hypothetical protein
MRRKVCNLLYPADDLKSFSSVVCVHPPSLFCTIQFLHHAKCLYFHHVNYRIYFIICKFIPMNLTFISPCIVIYSYSETNNLHLFLKLFILVKTLHFSDGLSGHPQELKTTNTATDICQTADATCCYWGQVGTPWISISCPLAAGSSSCLTYACCCMCSLEPLMMDGKTVRNM